MVDYETWVGVTRSVAAEKGADLRDFETNSQLVSVAAEVWNDRKQDIEAMSEGQARRLARQEVSVS